MDFYLQQLEQKSIYILRQAKIKFKNMAVLFSTRKDSVVCLALCRRSFFNMNDKRAFVFVDGGNFYFKLKDGNFFTIKNN